MRTTTHQGNEPDPDAPEVYFTETLSDVDGELVAQVTKYDQDGNVLEVYRPIEERADALAESPSTEGSKKIDAALKDTPKGHHDNPQTPGEGATTPPADSVDAKLHEPSDKDAKRK